MCYLPLSSVILSLSLEALVFPLRHQPCWTIVHSLAMENKTEIFTHFTKVISRYILKIIYKTNLTTTICDKLINWIGPVLQAILIQTNENLF